MPGENKAHKIINISLVAIILAGSSESVFCLSLPSSTINSGGGLSSSDNYSTRSSLGQFSGGSFRGTSHTILANVFSIVDSDGDGVIDNADNCQSLVNAAQLNNDADLFGDECDPDDDNDGLLDIAEAAAGTDPFLYDTDADGLNDSIDPDPLVVNVAGDLAPYGDPDGFINVADLMIMQRIILDSITPTPADIIIGDIYPAELPDGDINVADLLLLEQIILDGSE